MGKKERQDKKKKINKKFIVILLAMVIVGVIAGLYAYVHSLAHKTTDNAQIQSPMIPIIPHVSGYIDKVYVEDNQYVKSGDTLFTIQDQDYQVQLSQAKAALAKAQSSLIVAKAGIQMSHSRYLSSKSEVNSALESIETSKIELHRLTDDYQRYKNLYDSHSITKQQYEQALAAKEKAEKQLQIMKDRKAASFSQSTAASQQTEIVRKQVAVARAKMESAKALVEKAKLDIGYTVVTATIDGQLSNVDLQEGQFVASGQSLFYLVNITDKWVVANFKETQLTKIEKGQDVDIKVDAFPKTVFKGKVQAISPATGAQFSLLPPDNATGNFVKTVQRIPIKITFSQDDKKEDLSKLSSGMNVLVDVHIK